MRNLFLLLLVLMGSLSVAQGAEREELWQSGNRLVLHMFWSSSCPHCREALPFMQQLAEQRPWLVLRSYEVSTGPEQRERFQQLADTVGGDTRSVPAFFYCGVMQVGYDGADGIGRFIESQLQHCRRNLELYGEPSLDGWGEQQAPQLGGIDTEEHSLLALTLIIAALDAFNPCAFFILLFLLSLLVHQRSRGRIYLIGGLFVAVSGLLYFLFMAAWLNLFLITGMLRPVTLVAGGLALVAAAINIKDFFSPQQGPSLSLSDTKRRGLIGRMRTMINGERLVTMVPATILLALLANSYELLCTSGLPMLYTRILTLEELSSTTYYLYLLLYNLIYVVPLLIIVVLFAHTLGQHKLQAHEGRLLKLLSGLLMGGLALVLLFAPEALSHLSTAMVVVAVALAGTGVAWLRLKS